MTEKLKLADIPFMNKDLKINGSTYPTDSPELLAYFLRSAIDVKLAVLHSERLPVARVVNEIALDNIPDAATERRLDLAVIGSFLRSKADDYYSDGYKKGLDKYVGMTNEELALELKKREQDALYWSRVLITKKNMPVWDYVGEIPIKRYNWTAKVLFFGGIDEPKVTEVSIPRREKDKGNPENFQTYKLPLKQEAEGEKSLEIETTTRVIDEKGNVYYPGSFDIKRQSEFLYYFINCSIDRKIDILISLVGDSDKWELMREFPEQLDEIVIKEAVDKMKLKKAQGLIDARRDRIKIKKSSKS